MRNSVLAAVAAFLFLIWAAPALASSRPVVVELFTSQGCSSCPPADAYLRKLAKRTDVLPLAFHVDYWDRLGWRDTLDDPSFTARQRGYAASLGLPNIYTPQMVIDGTSEGVGNEESDIDSKIARAGGDPSVDIRLVEQDGSAKLVLAASPRKVKATLWLIRYRKAANVTIARGENRGETILYMNAVREMKPLGAWTGSALDIPLSKTDLANAEGEAKVALLQTDGLGPILGAARIDDPNR